MSPFSHLLAPAHLGSHEFQKAYKQNNNNNKKSELKQNKSKQNKKFQLHKIGRIVVCFSRVTKWQQF